MKFSYYFPRLLSATIVVMALIPGSAERQQKNMPKLGQQPRTVLPPAKKTVPVPSVGVVEPQYSR